MSDTSDKERSQRWVRSLTEVGQHDLSTAGGKGANLGELIRAGVRVPPGFVITTDAHAAAGSDHAIPADVAEAITTAYVELGGGPVAVRSSATAEDLPGAAFAGQQDTFLDVAGEPALLDAVQKCWASLWSERAVAYRQRRGIDDAGVRMAVVVQRMVPAEVAGVAFTANPVTGARTEIVIDAGLGLGEAVVSGAVTADHLVVDRQAGGEPPDLSGPALTRLGRSGVANLVAVARRIEDHFGRPQDIEWAYADQTLWIVQARPMTALPPPPLRLNLVEQMQFGMMAELLPVRPFPLDMTTWVVRGHGRILVRMARDLAGLRVDLGGILPEVGGVVDRLALMRMRPTPRTLTALVRMARLARRFSTENWTTDPRFAKFEREVARLRAVDPSALTWPELIARVDDAFAVLEGFIDLRVDYLPGAGVSLARLRLLLAVLGLTRSHTGLTAGIRTRTSDANRALRDLAALADDPTAFEAALRDYVDEYGHREVTSAFLVSQPTWGEDLDLIRSAARAMAGQPAVTVERTADAELRSVLARRRVRLLRVGPRIAAAAARARSGIAFREDTHFHASRLLPLVRGALLEAGERLARAEVLEAPGDVWHLCWSELTGVADPERVPPAQRDALRAVVAERAARREAYGGAPLVSPATLHGSGSATDALVSGNPASPGRATGPVRVIRGPEDFGRLQRGDVLVCPFTNPAWTPLFEIAVAAVVDTGSVGSHAAITAREYGIPAVMGTGNGTTVLTDGQRVEVDGATGAVRAVAD